MTAIYRAINRLSVGINAGEAFLATRLTPKSLKTLTAKGFIHELPMPPLRILAAFEYEYSALERRGYENLGDLLSSTDIDIEHLRFIGWQILNPPATGGCSNCNRRR